MKSNWTQPVSQRGSTTDKWGIGSFHCDLLPKMFNSSDQSDKYKIPPDGGTDDDTGFQPHATVFQTLYKLLVSSCRKEENHLLVSNHINCLSRRENLSKAPETASNRSVVGVVRTNNDRNNRPQLLLNDSLATHFLSDGRFVGCRPTSQNTWTTLDHNLIDRWINNRSFLTSQEQSHYCSYF